MLCHRGNSDTDFSVLAGKLTINKKNDIGCKRENIFKQYLLCAQRFECYYRYSTRSFCRSRRNDCKSKLETIWRSVEDLYKTGNSPLISLCLRRQGQIILNRSLGYAQGNTLDGLSNNAQNCQCRYPCLLIFCL